MKRKNICIAGHANSGKTSLGEAILYKANVTNRLGSTDKETSILDYMKYEKERKHTVSLSVASFEYNNLGIDLIDTPGYPDFQGDLISALSVSDSVIIIVDGSSGIEFTTEKVIEHAKKRGIPRLFFVSKTEKEDANFFRVFDEIKSDVGDGVLPLIIPIKEGNEIKGVVDLLELKAYSTDGEMEIPSSFEGKVKEYRESMVESLAEVDVELMEKFIDEEEISENDIAKGLHKCFLDGKVFPVISGDSLSLLGVDSLLKYVEKMFPYPDEAPHPVEVKSIEEPPVAFVFKTKFEPHVGELNFIKVWSGKVTAGSSLLNNSNTTKEKINQIFRLRGNNRESVDEIGSGSVGVLVKLKNTSTSDTLTDPSHPVKLGKIDFPNPVAKVAIEGGSEKEEDRISKGLPKIKRTDPTLNYYFDSEAKQLIIETMGEQHMQFVKSWLEEDFGVTVLEKKPRVHYRETIQNGAEGWAKFKKQTGGRGQYGEVYIKVEPLERGEGVEFENQIKGGRIPSKFIPSVEAGVRDAAKEGFLADYPVIDLKIIAYDGTYHPVDSSDNAFKRAGSMALKDSLPKASPYLLEPILKIHVIIPDEYTGDVMGDLNARRGRILGMEAEGKFKAINAYVPEREMYNYSNQLRSITQGTGTYTSEFAFYERAPEDIAEEIIREKKQEKEK
ncbi:MAG: elongation factor G [candidate division WOR-3 bacterium]|nr:elongation factor G [candidate division WOR-3 bacterium]